MTTPPDVSRPPSRTARPDASMTLLREVMERPLDPGYALAAARREAGEPRPRGVRRVLRSAVVLILAIALGIGGVWAARDLRSTSPGTNARTVLIDQIRERTAQGEAIAAVNADLQSEIRELQARAFGDVAAEAIAEGEDLGIWAGTTPVQGPGLVITMSDSIRAQQGEPGSEDERVQDFDLQVVVNGLWAAGAESIAINGVRLTSGTAIRAAGGAVLVSLRPLASPYTIEAIGDPDAMRTAFARTTGAAHLSDLSANYGITSELVVANDLTLPAGTPPAMTSSDGTE